MDETFKILRAKAARAKNGNREICQKGSERFKKAQKGSKRLRKAQKGSKRLKLACSLNETFKILRAKAARAKNGNREICQKEEYH